MLWREILRLDPSSIFGDRAAQLHDRNWGDRIPQPGYVGREYRAGGVVFVSMNPGAGVDQGLGRDDLRQYEVLKELADCPAERAPMVFARLTAVLGEIMPTWKIYRNFVAPILAPAAIPFSRVAYLNLLKWRTKSSSGLAKLYELSWRDHTKRQFDLLRPSVVIAIGVDAGNHFGRHYDGDAHAELIPRVIGNNVGQPGREAIARVSRWLVDHGGAPNQQPMARHGNAAPLSPRVG